jgi:hypothetical protein
VDLTKIISDDVDWIHLDGLFESGIRLNIWRDMSATTGLSRTPLHEDSY